ncbi:MAG: cell division protein FtsQ/DivIB [Ignavibacteriae bacterium]|nr:cell division protein FtsQ/DivIB [Ignavibacteriota bacterium]MCB9206941.1 hypothetical protein [Ignavibacteriales bacterium]MCB9210451.1 hypothetical protein [Ignavibacteriales bacterium]MCB9219738.1 hypothetical protein [Ignavibacteriales bacterium]
MKSQSELKHFILLFLMVSIIGLLAFSLESSDINEISTIKIIGNKYLEEDEYLKYSQLMGKLVNNEITIALIRDRLEKHPYIENIDVVILERGIAQVQVFEKKMDAVLLGNSTKYIITNRAEVLPLLPTTSNINLPVIVSTEKNDKIKNFTSATNCERLYSALKIISTAEIYDTNLYENISEIDLLESDELALHLSNFSYPIYFGTKNEIEKTVYLSKLYRHMQGNKLTEYLSYIDLRFNEMVYLGFNELAANQKESI